DAPASARRAPQAQAAREDGAAAAGKPAVDHAGHRRRMDVHREARLKNDTLLRALACQPTEYTPVWLMRQAGRYLHEYNARRALAGRVPLIGFSGSPFTLACYMVEGAGSDDWRALKTLLHARPELLHRILEVNARAVTDYLNAQIEAGVQVVMIFDTWGGILSYEDYERFSLSYCRRIFAGLLRQREGWRVPSVLFTKGGSPWLAAMMKSGCDAVGLDWTADAREARRVAGGNVALQGNLDPSARCE